MLLSFVSTFLSPVPARIALSNPPRSPPPPPPKFGNGGGAGALAPGGGGGGGAGGAALPGSGGGGGAELEPGIGGGGGASDPGIGGAGGGALGPVGLAGVSATAGDSAPVPVGLFFSSMAESGRGGPIVPKRMEARCFAEPPVGASSSSSEELSSVSITDQSSLSSVFERARVRDWAGEVFAAAVPSWDWRRWKGFVDC